MTKRILFCPPYESTRHFAYFACVNKIMAPDVAIFFSKKKNEFGFTDPPPSKKLPRFPNESSSPTRKPKQEFTENTGQEESATDEDEDAVVQGLPDRDRAEISQAITYFGLPVVKKVYSKNWRKRKLGLEELHQRMEEAKTSEKDKVAYQLQPALRIIHRGLRDKVFGVNFPIKEVFHIPFPEIFLLSLRVHLNFNP